MLTLYSPSETVNKLRESKFYAWQLFSPWLPTNIFYFKLRMQSKTVELWCRIWISYWFCINNWFLVILTSYIQGLHNIYLIYLTVGDILIVQTIPFYEVSEMFCTSVGIHLSEDNHLLRSTLYRNHSKCQPMSNSLMNMLEVCNILISSLTMRLRYCS